MNDSPLALWELVQTYHVVARQFRALFAEHDLNPHQYGVLVCLEDGDDFTKAQLARAVLITPQSMDPLIDDLIKRGLVQRDGPPRRGRAAGISITESGLELMAVVRPKVAALNTGPTMGLPQNELPRLVEQLRTIRATLEKSEH